MPSASGHYDETLLAAAPATTKAQLQDNATPPLLSSIQVDDAERGLARKEYNVANSKPAPFFRTRKGKITIVVLIIVIIAVIIGGAVGGSTHHHNNDDTISNSDGDGGGSGNSTNTTTTLGLSGGPSPTSTNVNESGGSSPSVEPSRTPQNTVTTVTSTSTDALNQAATSPPPTNPGDLHVGSVPT
ncbi:hypothetical protein C0995_006159 [Termitomyces sp. Mi166|nr:hypothetical protein C0995_006159 [Termitomyces sp. Mi166\